MEKFSKIKQWFTPKEAAQLVSKFISEKVKPSDLFQLSLDNKLPISIYFPNTILGMEAIEKTTSEASILLIVKHPSINVFRSFGLPLNAKFKHIDATDITKTFRNLFADDDNGIPLEGQEKLIKLAKEGNELDISIHFKGTQPDDGDTIIETMKYEVYGLQGLYDFPLIGSNKLDIKQELLWKLKFKRTITDVTLEGNWVKDLNGKWFQLVEYANSFLDRHHIKDEDEDEDEDEESEEQEEKTKAPDTIPCGIPEDSFFVYRNEVLLISYLI
ncbi:MAG: hypothetical protein CMI00_13105 [Oceanospirillaceae bacterium]|nr:hypothetical protein [Oceanospirillaceae bacterium]